MTLSLPDKWLWDFWTVVDGDDLHVFYLQADRALGNPDLRHFAVSIGHAITTDLHRWSLLPDALAPSPTPAWDDMSTWTGSIVRHDGVWQMLYTGTSRAEDGLVQRIGRATSADLVHWERGDGPVLEADPRWYELLDRDSWFDQAWRDPWVFESPEDGRFHAYVTARAAEGPARGRGVIGHAVSDDLRTWQVLPPVTRPMGFGQMEVPQLVAIDDRWYLLFSSDPSTRLPDCGVHGTGTYTLSADSPFGPFDVDTLHVLEANEGDAPYAGKIVAFGGALHFLGWEGALGGGPFRGSLSAPRTVRREGRDIVVGREP